MDEPRLGARPASDAKRLATLTAQLALRGFAVHQAADGYVVVRWNLTKRVVDLNAMERFARVVGAA